MIRATDDTATDTALERTYPPLCPTVYRPSRPSVTRIEKEEGIRADVFRGPGSPRAGVDGRDAVREGRSRIDSMYSLNGRVPSC
jgi:hypothetical protein